ncbi:MAG: hypothetical protein EWM72_02628 [Nitrospira sp.]|nr:MAG: hypothetical protein EWM72_02628 [Nitrospira sp.]
MGDDTIVKSFRLAPMSPLILTVTTVLLVLPLALFLGALFGGRFLSVSALIVVGIYVWVWLRFRPRRLVVRDRSIEVIWPLKRRTIPRVDISNVRLLDREELRKKIGSGLRVGAGGLWSGFGWLWTKRRGIVQMYVSRTDCFVWIERKSGRLGSSRRNNRRTLFVPCPAREAVRFPELILSRESRDEQRSRYNVRRSSSRRQDLHAARSRFWAYVSYQGSTGLQ